MTPRSPGSPPTQGGGNSKKGKKMSRGKCGATGRFERSEARGLDREPDEAITVDGNPAKRQRGKEPSERGKKSRKGSSSHTGRVRAHLIY